MKVYIIPTLVLLVAILLWVQFSKIHRLTEERDKYQSNIEILLQEKEEYQTNDSLNAVTVGILKLKISEFEKYRADDAELIKSLKTKNRDLENVTTIQLQTIKELEGTVKDSIVYLPGDTVTTVLRCVDIIDPWFELHGCAMPNDKFKGSFKNKESILIAATVKYKRFLGFLWKTNKVKNRKVDAVSRNPYTEIDKIEYIEIEE